MQRCIATVWYGHTGAVGIRVALRQQSTGRPLDTSYRFGLFSEWREEKKVPLKSAKKRKMIRKSGWATAGQNIALKLAAAMRSAREKLLQ